MRLKFRASVRLLRRYAWLGLALPGVYLGAASLAFVIRQRQANAAHVGTRLPVSPAPARSTRLMVFAPHCDDETLGCGGLIQQTLAAGGQAQAVMLTNGDGFRTAVECQAHSLQIGPQDYIRYADTRQQESLNALANLGIAAKDVRFLGYPDQGLQSLWNDNWKSEHLYTSTTTRCDHAPYATIFHSRVAYCGQNVLDDIKANLRAFHPTLVTVTHPSEDHADHAAAAAFVTRALQELQADPHEASWAKQTRLEHYLVHRGDWPLPQQMSESRPLLPPVELASVDTRWTTLPLTSAQTRRKAQSISLYTSQTAMMGRFLNSFVRGTELFGALPAIHLPTVPEGTIRVDANADDWHALPPCLLDPVRDNVLRDLQGGGDIRALYACRDSRFLYVRLDCRQPVSRRLTYTLHLRPFGAHGETGERALVVRLRPTTVTLHDGVRLASHARILEAAIPLQNLTCGEDKETEEGEMERGKREGMSSSLPETPNTHHRVPTTEHRNSPFRTLAISAETWGGVEIDKTGVRFLQAGD